MLIPTIPSISSCRKGVYTPKCVILHAALLRQGFPHCAKFPTAASRRSLDRVSVPVWLIILSNQLPVIALVSLYLTNKLIGDDLILWRKNISHLLFQRDGVSGISGRFQLLFPSIGDISHLLLTRAPLRLHSVTRIVSRSTCMC